MTRQQNLDAQERLATLIADRELDRLGEVFAADVVDHDPAPDQAPGAAGIIGFWQTLVQAFPDLSMSPDVTAADDDTVTIVITIRGTHQGDFLGHPATGRTVAARGVQVARFDDDARIVERWGATDELGILQQLGVLD